MGNAHYAGQDVLKATGLKYATISRLRDSSVTEIIAGDIMTALLKITPSEALQESTSYVEGLMPIAELSAANLSQSAHCRPANEKTSQVFIRNFLTHAPGSPPPEVSADLRSCLSHVPEVIVLCDGEWVRWVGFQGDTGW